MSAEIWGLPNSYPAENGATEKAFCMSFRYLETTGVRLPETQACVRSAHPMKVHPVQSIATSHSAVHLLELSFSISVRWPLGFEDLVLKKKVKYLIGNF